MACGHVYAGSLVLYHVAAEFVWIRNSVCDMFFPICLWLAKCTNQKGGMIMEDFVKISGTYKIKLSENGNVIFGNDNFKTTLKPDVARALANWILTNVDGEAKKNEPWWPSREPLGPGPADESSLPPRFDPSACPHNNVQQFTEICLDCGRNIYEGHITFRGFD